MVEGLLAGERGQSEVDPLGLLADDGGPQVSLACHMVSASGESLHVFVHRKF